MVLEKPSICIIYIFDILNSVIYPNYEGVNLITNIYLQEPKKIQQKSQHCFVNLNNLNGFSSSKRQYYYNIKNTIILKVLPGCNAFFSRIRIIQNVVAQYKKIT